MIVRAEKNKNNRKPFVQLFKTAFEDKTLSYRAKGLWASLMAKPDNWEIRMKDLLNHGTEGSDAIRSALQNLEHQGYAKLFKGGPTGGSYWVIYETPDLCPKDQTETGKNSDMPQNGLSDGERHGVLPDSAKTDFRQNGILSNNKELNNNNCTQPQPVQIQNRTESINNNECTSTRTQNGHVNGVGTSIPDQVQVKIDQKKVEAEEIYQLYPRKAKKPKALKAILKALNHVQGADLREKTAKFAELWKEAPADQWQFCPHPATWFNDEQYNDDPKEWNKPKQSQSTQSRFNSFDFKKKIQIVEDQISEHPANHLSTCHQQNCTQDQKDHLKRLRQTLNGLENQYATTA